MSKAFGRKTGQSLPLRPGGVFYYARIRYNPSVYYAVIVHVLKTSLSLLNCNIMAPPSMPILPLSEMVPGQEADLFVLLTTKEQLTTREGKPYFRVAFRDRRREVSFPIWDNSPLAADCRDNWNPGVFYKVRAVYRETNYGPQLDIRKLREVVEADADDGFDPTACLPQSRFDPQEMFEQLLGIVREQIERHRCGPGGIHPAGTSRHCCCESRRPGTIITPSWPAGLSTR